MGRHSLERQVTTMREVGVLSDKEARAVIAELVRRLGPPKTALALDVSMLWLRLLPRSPVKPVPKRLARLAWLVLRILEPRPISIIEIATLGRLWVERTPQGRRLNRAVKKDETESHGNTAKDEASKDAPKRYEVVEGRE